MRFSKQLAAKLLVRLNISGKYEFMPPELHEWLKVRTDPLSLRAWSSVMAIARTSGRGGDLDRDSRSDSG